LPKNSRLLSLFKKNFYFRANCMDFTQQRHELVNKLRHSGITDKKVLDLLEKLPRHEFMDKHLQAYSYDNEPQSIGHGQTISQPYIVALMTECLNLTGNEKVLEIGTGCGYQTAVLCELAKEVYSIERIEELYLKARQNLEKFTYKNIHLKQGDGTIGWKENAPFDAIIVTAKAPEVPEPLKEQLSMGGRLVIPVGKGSPQDLIRITKKTDGFATKFICSVIFVPLIGEHSWNK
jgi:protein-L-isoaspartate(D-aspartate) O-methyltransferase